MREAKLTKVFWFFFSKKNFFLKKETKLLFIWLGCLRRLALRAHGDFGGFAEELAGALHFHDVAADHGGYEIGDANEGDVVGDHDDSAVAAAGFDDGGDQGGLAFGVEVGVWFVQDQDWGIAE
jgi:hypothetical protein